MARLDERLHDLFGEERVASRAGVDRVRQALEARVPAEQVVEQLADRFGPERRERNLVVPRLLHPL